MSPRALLVLMVLFMVLGTFAVFDPLRRAEKAEEKEERDTHVLWLKDKLLEGLTVSGKHGLTELVCAKAEGCGFDSSGDWNLTRPVEGKADTSSAATLASTILNLRHSEKLELGAAMDPKEYGLDQPRAELILRVKGEQPITLKFGKDAAVGPNVYLSVSSAPGTVFLVPSYMPDMVSKEGFHWQNKRIFPAVESHGFTRIGWSGAGRPELRAVRVQDRWRLERPVPAAANHLLFEGLASTLAHTAAKGIFSPSRASPEGKKLLAGRPELEILFASAEGTHQLKLYPAPGAAQGQGPKQLVAAADQSPALYLVDASVFDRFRKPALQYRRLSLLESDQRNKITEARFTFPREKQETILKFANNTWAYSAGAKPADQLSQERIDRFLNALRDADIKAFQPLKGNTLEAKAYRTQTPELYLELKDREEKLLLAAKFVVHNRGLVLTEAEGEVATMGEDVLRLLPVRLSDLYATNNKQVVVPEEKKDPPAEEGEPHGSPHHPGHDHAH